MEPNVDGRDEVDAPSSIFAEHKAALVKPAEIAAEAPVATTTGGADDKPAIADDVAEAAPAASADAAAEAAPTSASADAASEAAPATAAGEQPPDITDNAEDMSKLQGEAVDTMFDRRCWNGKADKSDESDGPDEESDEEKPQHEKWYTVRLAECANFKDKGAREFKAGQFKEAAETYSRALKCLTFKPYTLDCNFDEHVAGVDLHLRATQLLLPCLLNVAACALKTEDWPTAIGACDGALVRDESNVKALYRRGVALMHSYEYKKARASLLAAAHADPTSRETREALAECKRREAATTAADRAAFANVLG